MEVTRENVPEAVAALRTALQGARFCAVDLEMVRAARLERKGAATNFLRPLASRASRRPPDRDALRARKALSLTVRGAVAGCEARLRRGGLSVLAAFSPDC